MRSNSIANLRASDLSLPLTMHIYRASVHLSKSSRVESCLAPNDTAKCHLFPRRFANSWTGVRCAVADVFITARVQSLVTGAKISVSGKKAPFRIPPWTSGRLRARARDENSRAYVEFCIKIPSPHVSISSLARVS